VEGALMLFSIPILFIIGIIFYNYFLAHVSGNSMYPTLHDDDVVLINRFYHSLNEGRIYIFKSPDNYIVIKRLKHIRYTSTSKVWCWFEGDNAENSTDS
jgi:signal peptidase I